MAFTGFDKLANDSIMATIQAKVEREFVVLDTLFNRTSSIKKGERSFRFSEVSSRGAYTNQQNIGDREVTPIDVAYADTKIQIDDWKGGRYPLQVQMEQQSAADYTQSIREADADSWGLYIEDKALTAMSATTTTEAVTAGKLALSNVSKIRAVLAKRAKKLAKRNKFLVCGPNTINNLLSIANIIETDKYSSNTPIIDGEVGKLFGFRVIEVESDVLEPTTGGTTNGIALAYIPSCYQYGYQFKDVKKAYNTITMQDEIHFRKGYGAGVYDLNNRCIKITGLNKVIV